MDFSLYRIYTWCLNWLNFLKLYFITRHYGYYYSLTSPLLNEVPFPSQESELSCILYVCWWHRCSSSISMMFQMEFGTVLMALYFVCYVSGAGTAYPSEHPSSSQDLVGFVFLDLDFSMYCFVDHFLSLCLFSFDHCIFCHSSVYNFWLLIWYTKVALNTKNQIKSNQTFLIKETCILNMIETKVLLPQT